jgi:hypothetical protein
VSRRLLGLGAGAVLLAVALAACTGPGRRTAGPLHPEGPQTAGVPGPSASSTLPPAGPSAAPSSSGRGTEAGRWHPGLGLTWQWQLTGTVDTSVPADVYDLDAFTTPPGTVEALKRAGKHTICYVNAGAREDFRPDAKRFPESVVGHGLDGWPGEQWLDVRRWDLIEPVLTERFTTCRNKGFDAVEPDNVDGYGNDSGFPLTAADQATFNRRVADLAHRLDLAVGLKNDVEQAAQLEPAFDFAVNEECARYRECDRLRVFTAAGKPVFHVEYDLDPAQFCGVSRTLRFSSMKKKLDLDAWRQSC